MREAEELMKEKRIRHLPVINSEKMIVGMLSKTDLTDITKFSQFPVDIFASTPVEWVLADCPLWRVSTIMIEKKISSVILCSENGEAVGIITSNDLLFQFSQILKEKEKASFGGWIQSNTLTTAGEFIKKLADIGI